MAPTAASAGEWATAVAGTSGPVSANGHTVPTATAAWLREHILTAGQLFVASAVLA